MFSQSIEVYEEIISIYIIFHFDMFILKYSTIALFAGRHLDPDLVSVINRRISIIVSMGVRFVSEREEFPGSFDCLASNQDHFETNRLTFKDIKSSFDSHLVAVSVCIVVLIIEICYHSYTKRQERKKKREKGATKFHCWWANFPFNICG